MTNSICVFIIFAIVGCHFADTTDLTDPCGGSRTVVGTTGAAAVRFSETLLKYIARSANESFSLVKNLKESYILIRLSGSQKLVSFLSNRHLSNFPKKKAKLPDVGAALQRDFNDLSTIIVFMRYVLKDATSNIVTDVEPSLLTTLCTLSIAVKAKAGNSVVFGATRDVMPDGLKNPDDIALKHARDYIILKDTEVFLKDMLTRYQ